MAQIIVVDDEVGIRLIVSPRSFDIATGVHGLEPPALDETEMAHDAAQGGEFARNQHRPQTWFLHTFQFSNDHFPEVVEERSESGQFVGRGWRVLHGRSMASARFGCMELLDSAQREEISDRLVDWKIDGEVLRRTFVFGDFVEAMGFVTRVAILAEKANHHPDIDIRWNKLTLALTTHDAGGLTDQDVGLAEKIDGLS